MCLLSEFCLLASLKKLLFLPEIPKLASKIVTVQVLKRGKKFQMLSV